MTIQEIDLILSESALYNKEVRIQLNTRDEFGRLLDSIQGFFHGESYQEYFVIDEKKVEWSDVRNIKIIDNQKWFKVDMFAEKKIESSVAEKTVEYVVDENYQPFYEE